MFNKLATILIISGLILFLVGGYSLFRTNYEQNRSLQKTFEMLADVEAEKEVISEFTINNFQPLDGETIGLLEIPKIEGLLPIIEGTDEDELEKGVGHLKSSTYPGQKDQIVLSGHRDTVFRKMGELEVGDSVVLKLTYGTFLYEITDLKIVDEDDRTIIQSTYPREELILSTCFPFTYVGPAPQRYVITALPVER